MKCKCEYDSDGGKCTKCGETVADKIAEAIMKDLSMKDTVIGDGPRKCSRCGRIVFGSVLCKCVKPVEFIQKGNEYEKSNNDKR